MSSEPRALLLVDHGTATTAVGLVARVAGAWRLLGASSAPASVAADAVAERLRARLVATDADLADQLGLGRPGAAGDLPRSTCRTTRPGEIAVVAATRRVLDPLAAVAASAGWRVRPLVLDGAEILPVATALADPRLSAVLAGSSDPPGGDERGLLPDLGAVVAAATDRRPDLVTVLAGGLAVPGNRVEALFRPGRPGPTVLAPSPQAGGGVALRELLDGLRSLSPGDGSSNGSVAGVGAGEGDMGGPGGGGPGGGGPGGGEADGRRALARATATLAEVLRRRVELVEIGQSGATRALAGGRPGRPAEARWGSVPSAALLPPAFTEAHLDAVTGWLPMPADRLRVRDRLRELALVPWGDAAGEGALLRLAAARAALDRLLRATSDLDTRQAADVIVVAGGAWSVAPAPAVALALADVLRRPGVRALGWDHARLLGPLGAIDDDEQRRRMMGDLRDDLLLPLGSVVMPAGLRAGRTAGRLSITGRGRTSELDLEPGHLERVELAPGERAVVELRFRDAVDLGVRVRHAAVEVVGGLGGLLVDLRGVPLWLPERPDRRRDVLAAWQGPTWPGLEMGT